ncbi:MAG: D-alanyl-D-alanine carboxypeptidase [Xylanivirga thermophila]|uniref:D-alanyl-D-alanine carboxypeptidase family protein n=1 Tax=Xylanivirga thermophila TaxID=2496273 RepID=UPI0013ED2E80|nr:D-alanyl-D-alanine carboxypeptidase family protein [Xylanivirga thermophila]
MKKVISIILVIAILLLFPYIMMTVNLDAQGAVLMDATNGKILYGKNKDRRMYPASTTKILTSIIVAENTDLDSMVTVGDEISLIPGDSSKAGIEKGETLTVRDLLMGLMLASGNDAACTLAVYTARLHSQRSDMPVNDAMEYFVGLMNRRAGEIGVKNSHFVNPHGYHHPDHYSTPKDMALITKEGMKYPIIKEAGDMEQYKSSTGKVWKNRNLLIQENDPIHYYPYAKGLKTGYTSAAGYCVVSYAKKADKELISVVFKSTSEGRWLDSRALLSYGFGDRLINTRRIDIIVEDLAITPCCGIIGVISRIDIIVEDLGRKIRQTGLFGAVEYKK